MIGPDFDVYVHVCVPVQRSLLNPGSLWYGFSFMRLCMDIITLEILFAGLQAGPVHVLKNVAIYLKQLHKSLVNIRLLNGSN